VLTKPGCNAIQFTDTASRRARHVDHKTPVAASSSYSWSTLASAIDKDSTRCCSKRSRSSTARRAALRGTGFRPRDLEEVVTLMGGELGVEGKGSRQPLFVRVPVRVLVGPATRITDHRPQRAPLIVDDNATNALLESALDLGPAAPPRGRRGRRR